MARPAQTIVYVTRDIERALGMEPQEGYFVITNRTAYSETIAKEHPEHVLLIESPTGESLGTADLLKHEKTLEFLGAHRDSTGQAPHLLVFKNTARIEPIALEQGWKLINPSAALADKIENKITQVAWLGALAQHLPAHRIEPMKSIVWKGEQFVIQWGHGFTGSGTILITSGEQLAALQQKFPERRTRISSFVDGPSFTVNVICGADRVIPGNINYQITGMTPFTDNAFSTVGNDWKLAHDILSDADTKAIQSLIQDVGMKMRAAGWLGLFGLDFIKDSAAGRIYLIEINARQPASTTYESHLQEMRRSDGAAGMTTFEAHLMALLRQPLAEPVISIDDGAQIIQRVTPDIKSISDETLGSLELAGYEAMAYPNTDPNADLVRIQSEHGIMAEHGAFNDAGNDIRDTILQPGE